MERNRPRGWILDDALLREIIVRVPRSIAALQAIPEIPEGVMRHCGEELLAIVAAADVPNPAPALELRQRADPLKTALVKKLGAVVQATATELGISPEVLATRRDLERMADGGRDISALQGWRLEAVGERLLAAV